MPHPSAAFQGPLANAVFRSAERPPEKVTTHLSRSADAMIRQYLAAGIGRPGQYSKNYSGFSLLPFYPPPTSTLRARFGLSPENIVVGKIARYSN